MKKQKKLVAILQSSEPTTLIISEKGRAVVGTHDEPYLNHTLVPVWSGSGKVHKTWRFVTMAVSIRAWSHAVSIFAEICKLACTAGSAAT